MYQKRWRDRSRCQSPAYFSQKSGQVTIFVIIGILLLLGIVLVLVLRGELTIFQPGEIIPTEKGKIEQYVTKCIEQLGDQALRQMGVTGGYIDIPADLQQDAGASLRLSPFLVVPYWAYGNQVNIPSLSQLKERIDTFMGQELPGCLFADNQFTQEYDVVERGAVESNVQITDKKVVFSVHYPIEVRSKQGTVIAELTDHEGESPIKLKSVHDTARKIVEFELNDLKFEDLTVDLLSLEHKDVPLTGIELSCSKKQWNAEQVKQTLKDLLRVNVGKLKVKGTDYVEFPETLPYYQHHYVWDILVEDEDMATTFLFDESFPFQFAVTPTPMKSSGLGGQDALSAICIQQWKFTYDISYPVLAKVIDQTTGYVFNTAFTVHVYRNRGDRGAEYVVRNPVTVERFDDQEYCANRRVPMTVMTYELIENRETGIHTREPLKGTTLDFSCLKYGCSIGETIMDSRVGQVARYQGNFPFCHGGIVRGTKDSYREDWERVVVTAGKEVELSLVPLHQVPWSMITVMKHELQNDGSLGTAQPLGQHEMALVTLSTVQTTEPYETQWPYAAGKETGNLEFLGKTDFTYLLDIQLSNGQDIVGGYKGNWTVDWETLQPAKQLTFHVVSKKSFSDETEQFAFIGGLEQYSKSIPLPEMKK